MLQVVWLTLGVSPAPFPARFAAALLIGIAAAAPRGSTRAQEAPAEAPRDDQEGAEIAAVTFTGSPWIPRGSLERLFGIRPGERLSAISLARGLERLRGWTAISRAGIPVVTPRADGRAELSIEIEARPRVRSVLYTGRRALSESALAEGALLGPGSSFDSADLEAERERLLGRYREEGFLFVEVGAEVRPAPEAPWIADLVFAIQEGRRVSISAIRFTGNDSIPDRHLRAVMEHRPRFLYGLISRGFYQPDLLEDDLERLRELYRSRGFLGVRVVRDRLRFDRRLEDVELGIIIEEGPRFRLEAVRIVGPNPALIEGLSRQIRTRPGGLYDGRQLADDLRRLRDYYQRQTFRLPRIELRHIFHLDPGDPRVIAVLWIDERRHFFTGKLEAAGNTHTRDRVIRSAATIAPGGPLTQVALEETAQELFNLGFFESVEPALADAPLEQPPGEGAGAVPGPDLEPGDLKDVTLAVVEKPTGFIEVGGGASSGEGEIFALRLTQPNFDLFDIPGGRRGWERPFSGGGQLLVLEFYPGTRESEFRFRFEEPYLYNSSHSLVVDGSNQINHWREFDEIRYRGEVGVRRFWDRGRRFYSGLSWVVEDAAILNTDDDVPADVEAVKGHTFLSYPSLRLRFDDRLANYYSGPLGPSAELRFDLAGRATGSEARFARVILAADHRQPLNDLINRALPGEPLVSGIPDLEHVLQLGLRLGWMEGTGGAEVPFFERFFIGGPRTLRGFSYRRVGPHDGGTPLGGEAFWSGTAQYSFPLGLRELRGMALFDFGDIESRFSDLAANHIRTAAGGGLQVRIHLLGQPVPVNLYWVEALHKLRGDEARLFTFTLGFSF